MPRDISPEEKLLRLIRSKGPKQAPDEVKVNAPSLKPASQHVNRAEKKPEKIIRFVNLNTVLILALLGVIIYSVQFFVKRPKTAIDALEDKLKYQTKAPVGKTQESVAEKRPSLEYFATQVEEKNIFSPATKEEAATQAPVEQGPKLDDIKSQLNLLGVISGDNPQAIIEDKKTQKSYFLNKGSKLDDIEVKDILENKVILSYKGQEFELVL